MAHQIPLPPNSIADLHSEHGLTEIAPDLAYRRLALVNIVFCGFPGVATGIGS
jgi:hypothetical protein